MQNITSSTELREIPESPSKSYIDVVDVRSSAIHPTFHECPGTFEELS